MFINRFFKSRSFLLSIIVIMQILTSLVLFAETNSRILLVSAEKSGIFQTGGLAHAVGGLALAFNKEGIVADVAMPFYLQMQFPNDLSYLNHHIEVPLDLSYGSYHRKTEFFVIKSGNKEHGETILFRHIPSIGQQNYFDNRSENGKKFYGPDNTIGEAFGAWSKAVSEYILSQNYEVVILNDWHTGLVALYLDMAKKRGLKVPKVVLAIHNLAFQGLFPSSYLHTLGIPHEYFSVKDGIEFHHQISFLKAAMQKSDLVYTVSPNYASEIATPLFGAGLDGLVRRLKSENKMEGVLNGIINEQWDPSSSYHESIQWTFSPENLTGKSEGKKELQVSWKLPVDASIPIFVLTSRLAEQKGFAYLTEAIHRFLQNNNAQVIIIGDGEKTYIDQILQLQNEFPDKVRYSSFSERSEKMLIAYGDFFVNAAWFEPSGLNQLFALKNGTIPILSSVGGLANSVKNEETGFLFPMKWKKDFSGYDLNSTVDSLVQILERANSVYMHDSGQILRMRQAGMKQNNSWNNRVNEDFQKLFNSHLGIKLLNVKCNQIF